MNFWEILALLMLLLLSASGIIVVVSLLAEFIGVSGLGLMYALTHV